ncbi:ABC transporter ATP-binding protein [Synechococcus sp. H55.11]|uniref:ABC transporter ATP-binding protein n=1 Tax=unclassified Synechococcus TaxID=2626047 RepID=UPI0039C2D8E9
MIGLSTAPATTAAIEVEHLSKTYGSFTAIRDISFQVNAGEIMGFLGPNGAGKTTSMRILAGYLPASEGTARVAGFDVHENSMAVRQRIGYLPENPPLYPDMTVEAYLHFVAQIKRVSPGDRPRRVDEVIRRCSLEDKRHTLIRKLSKGYKQRVGLAQALVHDPPVIILDEPTIGLDPKQIIEVRNLIKSLAGEHTIILSTHILPEVSMTCDRVVIINRGQVAAIGTPAELTAQLQDRQQAKLVVGAPEEAAIRAALQHLPQVEVVSLQPLGSDPPRWQVQLKSNAAAVRDGGTESLGWIPEVARALVQAGIALYEIGRPQASLEEIFLQLTTQEGSEGALEEAA